MKYIILCFLILLILPAHAQSKTKSQPIEITADDSLEWHRNDNKLIALGNALIKRTTENGQINTLKADKITAKLSEDKTGKSTIKKIEAFKNVTIKTPTETITGNYGIYNMQTNMAELKGNVKITRGPNILEGAHATVDMNTNVSKLFGEKAKGGEAPKQRVRGVFFPDSTE